MRARNEGARIEWPQHNVCISTLRYRQILPIGDPMFDWPFYWTISNPQGLVFGFVCLFVNLLTMCHNSEWPQINVCILALRYMQVQSVGAPMSPGLLFKWYQCHNFWSSVCLPTWNLMSCQSVWMIKPWQIWKQVMLYYTVNVSFGITSDHIIFENNKVTLLHCSCLIEYYFSHAWYEIKVML